MKKRTFLFAIILLAVGVSFLSVLAQIYLPLEVYFSIIGGMFVISLVWMAINKIREGRRRDEH